jgi:asparagine synthase (glutamine-hydrolysing)
VCGIAGVVNLFANERVRPELLRAMADSLRHRGPDDHGDWISGDHRVGLTHRRLAIVDLSDAGRQPMANADGSVQVTLNGEIYNFRALRAELELKGYRFRSQSDTEVLAHLYTDVGDAAIERLDGDFAFGLWDDRRRRLLLARDRAGVKPLYYTQVGPRFLFASEIKALLQDTTVAREFDEESLYHYLTYLVVPPPRTLLRGVFKLPAAGMLTLELDSGWQTRRYWEPLPGRTAIDRRNPDGQFEALFRRAVDKRRMSDVPVGVLFSGGVDSALNAAVFQQLIAPQRVKTFHVAMAGASPAVDEREWARSMAATIGTEHHEIVIDERDLVATAETLARHQDEPVSDPVCVPLYFVTRLAKERGVTVLHAGEGADEIFCGYENYRRILRSYAWLWRPIQWLPPGLGWLGFRTLRGRTAPRWRKAADVLRRRALGQELFLSGAVAYYEGEKAAVLARGFRERHPDLDSFSVVDDLYRRIEEQVPDATFLQKMTFIELQLRLPELLLMRVDKMAMAHAVEVRVPFLDRDLVDFGLSVDESFKLRDGVLKEPVKRLAASYVGRDAVYRPKTGFGAPILEWFGSALGRHMSDVLEEDRAEVESYFDVDELRQRLAGRPRTVNDAFQLWVVYNLLNWRRAIVAEPRAVRA